MTQRKLASVITEIITLFKCLGGGGVVERLGRWTCNSEAPSSSPALIASRRYPGCQRISVKS